MNDNIGETMIGYSLITKIMFYSFLIWILTTGEPDIIDGIIHIMYNGF